MHIVSQNPLLYHKTLLFSLSYFCTIFQYYIRSYLIFFGYKQSSYYPIAVLVFCVHPETPDSVDVTKGDRSSLNLV